MDNENLTMITDAVTEPAEVPTENAEAPVEPVEASSTDTAEAESKEDKPAKAESIEDLDKAEEVLRSSRMLINTVSDMARNLMHIWETTQKEFNLTEDQMKAAYQFNIEHRENMPEGLTEEERQEWDIYNGLNKLTEEDAVKIFGKNSPIISPIAHNVTLDRIKDALKDMINWLSAARELNDIERSYSSLLDEKDTLMIKSLEDQLTKEEDPEKRATMKQSLNQYIESKYLDFLKEPLPEDDIKRIANAINSPDKINYYLTRSRENLKTLGLSEQIILMLTGFEKRLLPEKYYRLNNLLLLYYVYTATFCKPNDSKNVRSKRVVSLTIALDQFVHKAGTKETLDRLMENIMAFEDQFMDVIK